MYKKSSFISLIIVVNMYKCRPLSVFLVLVSGGEGPVVETWFNPSGSQVENGNER